MLLSDLIEKSTPKAPLDWESRPFVAMDSPAADETDPTISGLAFDSRAVHRGDLFLCVPGEVVDGHDFAEAALGRGAAALLVQRWLDLGCNQVRVRDTRKAMGPISDSFFGEPSKHLRVVGVTGTNGKTTVVHLVHEILEHASIATGAIGTLTGVRTTPEAPELQRILAGLVEAGAEAVAMEVSSHALAQHRVDAVAFDVGVFTNLSPDHLDFHGDLEDYFEAKASLFSSSRITHAVINTDDPYGKRLAERVDVPVSTYGMSSVTDVELALERSRFTWRGRQLLTGLAGRFNIDNAVAAAEACLALGVAPEDIADGLQAAGPVPGRFEIIASTSDQPTVIVDYSHTPDGIAKILTAVRTIVPSAPITIVFGCGGDRDRSKRPLMGRAAAVGADRIIVTSDNPRSEDPATIAQEAVAGIEDARAGTPYEIVLDRADAIEVAIENSNREDVIVIAGKGHETTQTIGDQVFEFDDRVVARRVLGSIA